MEMISYDYRLIRVAPQTFILTRWLFRISCYLFIYFIYLMREDKGPEGHYHAVNGENTYKWTTVADRWTKYRIHKAIIDSLSDFARGVQSHLS